MQKSWDLKAVIEIIVGTVEDEVRSHAGVLFGCRKKKNRRENEGKKIK